MVTYNVHIWHILMYFNVYMMILMIIIMCVIYFYLKSMLFIYQSPKNSFIALEITYNVHIRIILTWYIGIFGCVNKINIQLLILLLNCQGRKMPTIKAVTYNVHIWHICKS